MSETKNTPPSGSATEQEIHDPIWDGMTEHFRTQGFKFGHVDLFLLDRTRPLAQLVRLVRLLTGFIGDAESCRCVFRHLCVVMPGPEPSSGESLKAYLDEHLEVCKTRLPDGIAFGDWLTVHYTDTRQEADLLATLKNIPRGAAVVIQDATVFRAPDIRSYDPGKDRVRIEEDLWVPHLLHVLKAVEQVAEDFQHFVSASALRPAPRRAEHVEAFRVLKGAILYGEREFNVDTEVLKQEKRIASRAADGRIGDALKAIDELPSALDSDKPFLKVQLYHRSGMTQQALDLIEQEFADVDDADPMATLQLAIIASKAGGLPLAAKLLRHAIARGAHREVLEGALELSEDLDNFGLTVPAERRLAQLFPDSVVLHRFRGQAAADAGDFASSARIFAQRTETASLAAFYWQCDALVRPEQPLDYSGVMGVLIQTAPHWKAAIERLLVDEGLRRRDHRRVYLWVLSQNIGKTRTNDLLLILENLVLRRAKADNDETTSELLITSEELENGVAAIVADMASRPFSGSLRVRLNALLSPTGFGWKGFAAIAIAALKAFPPRVNVARRPHRPPLSEVDEKRLDEFFEGAKAWLVREESIIIGRAVMPKDLLMVPADDVVRVVSYYLQSTSNASTDEGDLREITGMLMVGASVAPYATDKDSDLDLMRVAAGKLAIGGKVQQARNLAESIMQASDGSDRRKRMAWLAMADISQRVGNRLDAMVALACALVFDDVRDVEQALEEAFILARLCRDAQMFEFAARAIAFIEEVAQEAGFEASQLARLNLLRLQIAQGLIGDPVDPEKVRALLDLHAKDTDLVIDQEADLLPPALAFGQAIRLAKGENIAVSEAVRKAFEKMRGLLADQPRAFVDALSALVPSAEQVFALHGRVEVARYAEDAGFDAGSAAILARRYLDGTDFRENPESAAFAIELLADRSTATPGWHTIARPPALLAEIGSPATYARALSKKGLQVLMLAIDGQHRLVRLLARAGKLNRACIESRFAHAAFAEWRKRFPYGYGELVEQKDRRIDTDKLNELYISTEGMQLSDITEEPLVVCADVSLQIWPATLMRIGDQFLGKRQPVAAIPSLSWLAVARQRTLPSPGKRVAWISAGEESGTTFVTLGERLADTLKEHGVRLNNEERLPRRFDESELAIVVAHGGLLPDGSFFQRVHDEGHVVVDAEDFADAFRHPESITSVGLAKRLLAAGASAVVASPWPVQTRVTYHWLPAFLRAWDEGCTLSDAVFRANEATDKALGDLTCTLAMNVYGDPLVRRPL
jgi:hypothetical protein